MAKLYAELRSEKGGRVSNKTGNEYIQVVMSEKNVILFEVTFETTEHDAYIDILRMSDGTNRRIHYIDQDIPY